MRQSCLLAMQCRVAFRSPPAPPSGRSRRENTGGFPRGKQSARFALPCVPLVVCLNSGSLTACGGCAHRARASLRSPLHPFGESAYQWGRVCACGRTGGLSSGQTIGAVRTAVRSACCLPELRVANRLRRLCPLGTRFPTFPPAPLRIAIRSNRAPHRAASHAHTPESARQSPPGGISCGKVVF